MRGEFLVMGALLSAAAMAVADEPALVPAPRSVAWTRGTYSAAAAPGTLLSRDAELPRAAIRFETDAALPAEGYRLEVAPSGVTVWSADAAGAFYATRTLKQMSRVGGDRKKGFTLDYPCGTVTDAPAFRWRGFMLDEGRHFFGREVVCRYLDLMADHKLNVFHWHLTEDQGWRLAIDRFPELVKYGSVRPESVRLGYTGRPQTGDQVTNGEKYGPYFYTADDVREILDYAAARHITVIPEIEVPGHVRALLAAHPEFSCRGDIARVPRLGNSIEDDVLCAGNDEAIRFIEQVYDEVMKLFPGAYFHLGGDECPKKRWKECPKCQARMKALGLKDEEELQGWFTRHFTEYLAKRGRRAIGWDEVLAGKPGLETVVQSWRANATYAVKAAEAGHDVIVSSVDATYFSVPEQHPDDPFTYMSPNRHVTLTEAYQFDPYKGMTEATKPRVIGAECALWSECIWNVFDLDYKAWPRTCAFAEAVWSAPSAPRDVREFAARAEVHRLRLIGRGVVCAPIRVSPTEK